MFSVFFYAFSKKHNSTALPVSGAVEIQCALKDNTSILNPVLEIEIINNPATYTYAYIPDFNRYYFVSDWKYIIGRWECELSVDVLGSYKTVIGNSERYILRCSKYYNKNAVDTFYPSLSNRSNFYTDSVDFLFDSDLEGGAYVIGIAARDTVSAGAITYYILTAAQISALVSYMLTQPADLWTNGFTGMTDVLYRSIYSPFDYIKSCKWFPIGNFPLTTVPLKFGNYESNVNGQLLPLDSDNWITITRTLTLPSNWSNLDAKYRTNPYANIYIVFNPFGIIELNPLDFSDTNKIKLVMYPDYISGDAILKIYKTIGANDYFITQKSARFSVEINLTAATVDFSGMAKGIAGFVGSAAAIASGNISAAAGLISAGSSVADFISSGAPSASNSVGITTNGIRAMEGIATLIYSSVYFSDENNDEFGKPLLETRILNTLSSDSGNSGYIKCADGEINISCFDSERTQIESYLTRGFYLE